MSALSAIILSLNIVLIATTVSAQSNGIQNANIQQQKRTITTLVSPEPNWSFDTYAAVIGDNVVSKQFYTSSVGTYVSTIAEEANQSNIDAVLAGFVGVSGQMRNGQLLGAAIGTGFGVLSLRPKLLGDLTLSFGPDQRMVVITGISIGQVTQLSSSVFQNEWGMVYRHQGDIITEVPLTKQGKIGFSFGLGWRLGK